MLLAPNRVARKPGRRPCADGPWRRQLPVLSSARAILREVRRSDAPSLAVAVGDPDRVPFLPVAPRPLPRTDEALRRFITWTQRERRAGRLLCFAVVPDGAREAEGLAHIWPLDRRFSRAEWGFLLAPDRWGTGLFEEIGRRLLSFAFEDLGVQRLEACVARQNHRGNAALGKLGAVRQSVLRNCFLSRGALRDDVVWSLLAPEAQPVAVVARQPVPSGRRVEPAAEERTEPCRIWLPAAEGGR